MVRLVPLEVIERIIFYYFHRDEHLTLSDDLTLVTPPRSSTSLLLVSKGFRHLVLPNLFYSISITQSHHWELLFRGGSGLLAGDGEEAKMRRSWVREIRLDVDAPLPSALEPDGYSLSPERHQEEKHRGVPFYRTGPSPGLITFSLPYPPRDGKHTLFPNLDRLVFLPTCQPPASWPRHLLRRLEDRFLVSFREDKRDPYAEYPPNGWNGFDGQESLEALIWEKSMQESREEKDRLIRTLEPRSLSFGLEDEETLREKFELLYSENKRDVRKHFIYPSALPLRLQTHPPSNRFYAEHPTTLGIHLPAFHLLIVIAHRLE